MKYAIKRGNTVIVEVHAEGQVTERIMGEQLVDATFSLSTKVQFQLWDSIAVDGRTYYLHATPTEEKLSKRNFRYTLQFAGVKYFLANILCLFPDKDNALTLSEFSITGTATKMLDLIVQNANREQSGWSLGTVATSETKQVDFSGHSCLSALAKVAEAFDLEYWVDANKTISLEERKQASGYTFQYGIHKGLKGITRLPVEGANIVTRVYAEGSEKNLPADYRNYKKRLQMPVPYLERNTAKYGVIEAVQRFDDIYPHRTGTVTAVNADNPLQFTDANMPFDLNAVDDKGNTTILIDKVSAKVTFNTGQLAGYTFEIKEGGYDHSKKTFELLVNKDEKDLEVPSEALRPAVGDTYVITDIVMPQSYITAAEVALQAKAQEYLDKNSEQRNVYEVVADPIYFAEQNVNIVVGHTCLFKDADFGLNAHLRVLGTVKNLQNLREVQFELGETATVIHIVRAYFKAEKNTTSLRQYLKYNTEMAKRSYSFAREIADNVFDNEGYFDAEKIKPLSIDTKLLTVGSRSQQFNLVDVLLTVEQNNTAVRNTAGQIIHLTIEDNPRTWNIPANLQTGIGAGFHYVYVKAQRVGDNASILVSPERIMLEQDDNYWHFEAGYLGSVQNGFRRIKTNYGFTQVSPGEIVTGRMSSANGQHYIDLLQDRINIKGNVEFTSDSPALSQSHKYTAERLKIGGHNLILSSKQSKKFYQLPAEKRDRYFNQTLTYTFSADATATGDIADAVFYCIGKRKDTGAYEVIGKEDVVLEGGKEKRIKCTTDFNISLYTKLTYKCQNAQNTIPVELKKPKLELGEIATDYDMADEDLGTAENTQIGRIEALERRTDFLNSTEIDGNAIATGTLMVGNGSGANAGICGLKDIPKFFAGSGISNANAAPFRVYEDGSVHMKKGTIGGIDINENGIGKAGGNSWSGKAMFLNEEEFEISQRIRIGSPDLMLGYSVVRTKVVPGRITLEAHNPLDVSGGNSKLEITPYGIFKNGEQIL